MTNRPNFHTARDELRSELSPSTPRGDDVAAAGDLVNFVLDRCVELTDAINRYATLRFEEAPTSSLYITDLAALLAFETTAWVRRWPA